MSIKTVSELKAKFQTGDIPTELDYIDLVDSTHNSAITPLIESQQELHTDTTEPTGFKTRNAVPTWGGTGNKFLTFVGTDVIYHKGTKHTVTNYSIDTTLLGNGKHFIYFQASGSTLQLVSNTLPWGKENLEIPVSILYRSSTGDKLGEERHGLRMDIDTHMRLHFCEGASIEYGGLEVTPTNDSISILEGAFWDEDLRIVIPNQLTVCVSHFDGVSSYDRSIAKQMYHRFAPTGTTPQYDNVGTSTDLTNGYFGLYWIMATHWFQMLDGAGNNVVPVASVLHSEQYSTISEASSGVFHTNIREVITLNQGVVQEILPLSCIIVKNNGGVAEYIEQYDLRYTTPKISQDVNPDSEVHFKDVYIHDLTGNVLGNSHSTKTALENIDKAISESVYYPTSHILGGFTLLGGTIATLSTRDLSIAGSIQLAEPATNNALYTVTIASVVTFNKVNVSVRYDGGNNHTMSIGLVGQNGKPNYIPTGWVINNTTLLYGVFHNLLADIINPTDYIDASGNVQVYFLHSNNNNATHRLYVDEVSVLKVGVGGSTVTTSFTTNDGKTVYVTNGIITSVV